MNGRGESADRLRRRQNLQLVIEVDRPATAKWRHRHRRGRINGRRKE